MKSKLLNNDGGKPDYFDTIIIGGGQAGLAAGYYLSTNDQNFIILDGNKAIGDSWRNRWDSLHLFTPSQFDNLPGMSFSKSKNYFPTKNEIADFLNAYAVKFNLPVVNQQLVNSLSKPGDMFEIRTLERISTAKNVIIASGPYQKPYLPAFANELDDSIYQLHSSEYQNPSHIPSKSILIIGAGNSGSEIALELVRNGKKVWLSGRDVGVVPANSRAGKVFDGLLVWWVMTHILTINTPIGRKVIKKSGHHGIPLGGITRKELQKAGIIFGPRVSEVISGKPQLEDGQILSPECVIWATGFKPDFNWVHLPVFDRDGYPLQSKGVAVGIPGLYFIGLPYQSGLSSSLLGGVGKDAKFITDMILKTGTM